MFQTKDLNKKAGPISIKICLICGKEDELDFCGRPMRFAKVKVTKMVNIPEFLCKLFDLPLSPNFEFKTTFTEARFCRRCSATAEDLHVHFQSLLGKKDAKVSVVGENLKIAFRDLMVEHLKSVSTPAMKDDVSQKFKTILKQILEFDSSSLPKDDKGGDSDEYDSDPFEDKLVIRKRRGGKGRARRDDDDTPPKRQQSRKRATTESKAKKAAAPSAGTKSTRSKRGAAADDEDVPKDESNSSVETLVLPVVAGESAVELPEVKNGKSKDTEDISDNSVELEGEEKKEESSGSDDNKNASKKRPLEEDSNGKAVEEAEAKKPKEEEEVSLPFKCDVEDCEKEFAQLTGLQTHKKRHHDAKRWICGFCDQDLKLKYNLEEHLDKHPEYKPLNCQHCGKTFKRDFRHQVAFQMHRGQPVDSCPYCKKRIPQLAK